jgi:hypothetical protein
MAFAKLMTNLLPQYYQFLQGEAKRQKRTMRQIVEEALALYRREKKKEFIREGYRRMGQDKEYLAENLAMAEEGMSYYLKDIGNEI